MHEDHTGEMADWLERLRKDPTSRKAFHELYGVWMNLEEPRGALNRAVHLTKQAARFAGHQRRQLHGRIPGAVKSLVRLTGKAREAFLELFGEIPLWRAADFLRRIVKSINPAPRNRPSRYANRPFWLSVSHRRFAFRCA